MVDIKPIQETLGKYLIASTGEVISARTGKPLKLKKQKNKYDNKVYWQATLSVNGKVMYRTTHRLLMVTFRPVDNMENLVVNHKDHDGLNNDLDNLEWCTQAENMQRKNPDLPQAIFWELMKKYGTVVMKEELTSLRQKLEENFVYSAQNLP